MALVAAKCTQCGANLEVDSKDDATICPFCHTPFITEKAINNYVTTIETLNADVVNVVGAKEEDRLYRAGEAFIQIGDYERARTTFQEMMERFPYDYRGYYGHIRSVSRDMTHSVKTYDGEKWVVLDWYSSYKHTEEMYTKMKTIVGESEAAQGDIARTKDYMISLLQSGLRENDEEYERTKNEYDNICAQENTRNEHGSEQLDTKKKREKKRKRRTKGAVITVFVLGMILLLWFYGYEIYSFWDIYNSPANSGHISYKWMWYHLTFFKRDYLLAYILVSMITTSIVCGIGFFDYNKIKKTKACTATTTNFFYIIVLSIIRFIIFILLDVFWVVVGEYFYAYGWFGRMWQNIVGSILMFAICSVVFSLLMIWPFWLTKKREKKLLQVESNNIEKINRLKKSLTGLDSQREWYRKELARWKEGA